MLNVVFAGGSHSSRMLDQISDPNTKLLDCTVLGFSHGRAAFQREKHAEVVLASSQV